MANNSTLFKKRANPLEGVKVTDLMDDDDVKDEKKVVEKKQDSEPVEVKKVVEKKVTPKVVEKVEEDNNREKYTATMEKSLRRRVKIASVKAGIQVSTFIEQACLEKLRKEED